MYQQFSMFLKYLHWIGKIAIKIGLDVCISPSVIVGNILRKNKTIFNDKYLFVFVVPDRYIHRQFGVNDFVTKVAKTVGIISRIIWDKYFIGYNFDYSTNAT